MNPGVLADIGRDHLLDQQEAKAEVVDAAIVRRDRQLLDACFP
ncbi:hypothetical protein [Mesorhizobium shangrilense]|uniref:Transposase n=1 Tax=Mesorhizobium shangrilense TaxID=460060 RepID=A0ABV2DT09_9HYPH